jgi:hypothetical protein
VPETDVNGIYKEFKWVTVCKLRQENRDASRCNGFSLRPYSTK